MAGDIANPLLAQIVSGAEVTLREAGYSLLLTNSLVDAALDQRNIELLEQRRADGLIVLLVSESHRPTIDALSELEVPLVVEVGVAWLSEGLVRKLEAALRRSTACMRTRPSS